MLTLNMFTQTLFSSLNTCSPKHCLLMRVLVLEHLRHNTCPGVESVCYQMHFLSNMALVLKKPFQCSMSLPLYFVIVDRCRAECSAVMGASSQRDELSRQPPPSLLSVPSPTPILQSHSSGWQDEYLSLPPLLQLVRTAFCEEVVGSLVN